MQIDFDVFSNPEMPNLILCNPNFEELYTICPFKAPKFSLRFTSISEMELTIYENDFNGNKLEYYDLLTKNRLIHVQNLGYWVIAGTQKENDGTTEKNTIKCFSYEYMLSLRNADLSAGTYKFYDSISPSDTLIGKLIAKLPSWSIGDISVSLLNKYRTFDMPDDSIYSFLTSKASEAYECIFTFDTENRLINAYDMESVLHPTEIVFTWDNLLKNVEISETDDPIITALDVYGSGDFSINSVNPLGTSTIYKFNYFSDQMPSELWSKVETWQNAVNAQMVSTEPADYPALLTQKKTLYSDILDVNADIAEIQAYLDSAKQVQDVSIPYKMTTQSVSAVTSIKAWVSGLTTSDLVELLLSATAYPTIDFDSPPQDITSYVLSVSTADKGIAEALVNIYACEIAITALNSQVASKNDEIESVSNSLTAINNELSMYAYFTQSELTQLDKFIFSSEYTNEYYVGTDSMTFAEIQDLSQELLFQGMNALDRSSQPNYTFSLDSVNFLFLKKYSKYIEQLELGCSINAEIKEGEWVSPILLELEFDYDSPDDLSLTWGNRYRLQVAEWTFADLYEQSSKTNSVVSSTFSDLIKPTRSGQLNEMKEFMSSTLNAANNNIVAGNNQCTLIDQHGILGRKSAVDGNGNVIDGQYSPEQSKLIHNLFCFTDDNWMSSKAAFGKLLMPDGTTRWGLISETLIGDIIAGQQLTIKNESNTFVVDANGVTLTDASFSVTNASALSRTIISPDDPIKVQTRATNADAWSDKLYVDANGNLIMAGRITATEGSIAGFTLSDSAMYTPSNALYFGTQGISATIAGSSRSGIILKAGSGFGVNTSGIMYANNCVLTNTTANGGTFTNITASGNITADSIAANSTISAPAISGGTISGASVSGITGTFSTLDAVGGKIHFGADYIEVNDVEIGYVPGYSEVSIIGPGYQQGNIGSGSLPWSQCVARTLYSSSGSVSSYSMRKLKKDIKPFSMQDGNFDKLQPVSYVMKSDDLNVVQIGFIADDILEICPYLVSNFKDESMSEGILTLDYARFTVLLVDEVKKIRLRLNELEKELQ